MEETYIVFLFLFAYNAMLLYLLTPSFLAEFSFYVCGTSGLLPSFVSPALGPFVSF